MNVARTPEEIVFIVKYIQKILPVDTTEKVNFSHKRLKFDWELAGGWENKKASDYYLGMLKANLICQIHIDQSYLN